MLLPMLKALLNILSVLYFQHKFITKGMTTSISENCVYVSWVHINHAYTQGLINSKCNTEFPLSDISLTPLAFCIQTGLRQTISYLCPGTQLF